jgi:hypothetical protein
MIRFCAILSAGQSRGAPRQVFECWALTIGPGARAPLMGPSWWIWSGARLWMYCRIAPQGRCSQCTSPPLIEQLAGERTAPTVKARLPQSVISLTGSLSARSYGLTPPRPTPKSAPFDERLAYATGFTLPRGPIRGLQRAFTENERRGIARSILDHLQLCGWRFDHYPPPRGLACSPAGTHASNACACLLP